MNKFWNNYYDKPLNKIPWQNTQADWFKKLVDTKVITGATALDLGCGTGIKSIYLARFGGFKKVLGIDVAQKAIAYAQQNAKKEKVDDVCKFINADVVSWNFIKKEEKFNFILDWALLHCLKPQDYKKYSGEILNHLKPKGVFLLRVFGTNKDKKYFSENIAGANSQIHIFNQPELKKIFNKFKIIDINTSQPKTKSKLYFQEILFKKI